MWSRIRPHVPPAIIVLVTLISGRELVALRFAADAPAPGDPLLATAALVLGLVAAVVWALYRLTRREGRILVELFWSMLGMSVIVGVASVGITGTWPRVGSVLAWVGGIFLLWCMSLVQTEPGPDPAHLRTGPGAGFSASAA